jgi:Arrestin (or S-antigen), C-terminal domain
MGLFDKMKSGLKNVANRVTGGYGELSIAFDKEVYAPGDTLKAKILVTATEELKVTNITVQTDGYETANYKGDDFDQKDMPVKLIASYSDRNLNQKDEICGEMVLAPGDSKEFDYELPLPGDLPPTYMGKHVKNYYHMRVQVDVPWGVDLRESKDVPIVKPPSSNRFDEVRVQQQNRLCRAELVLPCATVKPGQELKYAIQLTPGEVLEIEKLTIKLRSVESMPGKIGRDYESGYGDGRGRGPGRRGRHQSDDTDWEEDSYTAEEEKRNWENRSDRISDDVEQLQKLDWEEEQINVTVDDVEDIPWEEYEFSKPETFQGRIIVPEDFGPSYRHDDREHRILFTATIDFGDRSPLKFEQEVMVCEGDWEPLQYQTAAPPVNANAEKIAKIQELVEMGVLTQEEAQEKIQSLNAPQTYSYPPPAGYPPQGG